LAASLKKTAQSRESGQRPPQTEGRKGRGERVYSRYKEFWALTEMVQRGKKSAKPQLEVDDSASSLASSW